MDLIRNPVSISLLGVPVRNPVTLTRRPRAESQDLINVYLESLRSCGSPWLDRLKSIPLQPSHVKETGPRLSGKKTWIGFQWIPGIEFPIGIANPQDILKNP